MTIQSDDYTLTLQEKIVSTIESNVSGLSVYDPLPKDPDLPYIHPQTYEEVDLSTADERTWEVTAHLRLHSRGPVGAHASDEAYTKAKAVRKTLSSTILTLDSPFTMVDVVRVEMDVSPRGYDDAYTWRDVIIKPVYIIQQN